MPPACAAGGDGVACSSPFDAVTAERGFLPNPDPPRRLLLAATHAAAAEWEEALHDIPKLALAAAAGGGALRRALAALPPFPLDALLLPPTAPQQASGDGNGAASGGSGERSPAAAAAHGRELWRAYLLLSFLSHAFMWCEPGPPPAVLPAVLAVPWARVAAAAGMPPVLTYSTYNLLNWRRLDPAGPVALGNLVCLHNFLGGPDEEWFRCVHVEVEARAAPAVAALPGMQAAAAARDPEAAGRALAAVADSLRAMQATLARMGEQCDPYIYYQRVRTPMSGWRNNPALPQGLVYEGVSATPLQLYGETGAQSSVLHAFDAALGVEHEQGWLRDYLDAQVAHMPPPHRAFIARLAAANAHAHAPDGRTAAAAANVRAFVMSYDGRGGSANGSELRERYNDAINEMEKFRSQHKAFAYTYISKWSKAEEKGTGGSDFMPALAGYRDTTARQRLK